MAKLREWHRWLGMSGPSRFLGKSITGVANLGFLFLVMSGAYLWLPRVYSWRHFRPIIWFRGGLSGKARDFNWHNAIGIWCLVPLFFIVLSGVVIGYAWAGDLVVKLAGGPAGGPPPQPAPQPPPVAGKPEPPVSFAGIDATLRQAMQHDASWRTVGLRVPTSDAAPLVYTVETGTGGQPQKRVTLTFERATGKLVKQESFADFDEGRKWRQWLRFVHTGEYYGVIGQTIAGIASLGAVFLVWTGVALSLRRFSAWRKRKA